MTPSIAAPQQAYRENAVLAASPAQLVVTLYDGAHQFLRRGAEAMRAGEIERAHDSLRRAEQIVAHLAGVLDHTQSPELTDRLQSLYRFCLAHLNRARWSQDASKVQEVDDLLGELRSAWAELAHG